jgi:MbtH protein
MLAASAAFRIAPSPAVAADVVGAMLARWHYIALAAPLLLFAIELRRVRRAVLIVLFTALVLAAAQALVDLRIRAIRTTAPVPVSSLDRNHPMRRQFGALHGASMLLLLLQTIAAAGVVAAREKRDEEHPMVNIDREDTTVYKTVMNAEDQYSIWPADRENPAGWRDAGFQGAKQECLSYIKEATGKRPPRNLEQADPSGGGP